MQTTAQLNSNSLARWAGGSLLATIVIGIIGAMTVAKGIDINLSADVIGTAENMLGAETQLHAKAYLGLLTFALNAVAVVGMYVLLRAYGQLLAGWSLFISLAGAGLALLGSVFAMNAAQLAGNEAFTTLTDADGRKLLAGVQAISDYTSFHLGLIISTTGMAGFFALFYRSGLIPKLIAGWGVFASLFVVIAIVARDFIPALGTNAITVSFMVSNLIAMLALGAYLVIKGVRKTS